MRWKIISDTYLRFKKPKALNAVMTRQPNMTRFGCLETKHPHLEVKNQIMKKEVIRCQPSIQKGGQFSSHLKSNFALVVRSNITQCSDLDRNYWSGKCSAQKHFLRTRAKDCCFFICENFTHEMIFKSVQFHFELMRNFLTNSRIRCMTNAVVFLDAFCVF